MKPNGRLSPQERMQRQRLRTVIAQKGCWRTMSVTARCGSCGAWPAKVHIPTEIKGFYCGACCPICTARSACAGSRGEISLCAIKCGARKPYNASLRLG